MESEIYDLKNHIESDIDIMQNHLMRIKSSSNIKIDQPLVEFQFETYLNNKVPDSKYYNDLRVYLKQTI